MSTLNTSCFIILTVAGSSFLFSLKKDELKATGIYSKPVSAPITMCGSQFLDWADTTVAAPKLFSDLGSLSYKVTTPSVEAQKFFNQGLRFIYGFNHWEAIQSFKHAINIDPDFAMAYWGLALAYGPNLNDVSPNNRERLAQEAVEKARAKNKNISAVERDLIEAIATRYDGQIHTVRDTLNKAYADAMIALAKKYPDDPEVQTNCADAIMNTMPWDYWLTDGLPKPATQQAKLVLEKMLKKFPDHPGANHLYIHLVEASPTPDIALNSAKVLETSMPAAGHLVHMPSHIYVRIGEYEKSIKQNLLAAKADEEYLSNSANKGMYRSGYYPHNIDFVCYSAYMEGRSELAVQSAMKLAYKGTYMQNASPTLAQLFSSEPLIAFVRFGRWQDVLSLREPDDKFIYANALSHFARGLAYLRTGKSADAQFEYHKLDSLSKLDTLNSVSFGLNTAGVVVKIPTEILKGELLLSKNKIVEGIAALSKAVEAEKMLKYNEPPDWKLHARQFLGGALLERGKFAEAEIIFQEDLKSNRGNIWSLNGLLQCQQKANNLSGAQKTQKQLAKASTNTDVKISSSRF